MKEDLKRTRWSRISVRLNVPRSPGVFLVGAGAGLMPDRVLMVGSASDLRARLLELLETEELHRMSARVIHWVADLTTEQARIAERLFVRRYDPPITDVPGTRYLDIFAG
jgi:excinuclease UvrABC nuclease subunit